MSPLVDEMLEVNRNERWQLSIQPAGIDVLSDRDSPPAGTRTPAAAPVSPAQAPPASTFAEPRRAPGAAALAGAAVGILGGLLGLGGAEFRLPLLVGYFHYPLAAAIALNLAVSFVTVVAGAASRLLVARETPDASVLPLGIAMMLGGMGGAATGSRWLARTSERRLQSAVRTLLVGIGLLLMIESATVGESHGLPLGPLLRAVIAAVAGVLIGIVSTLLGVAGGELIIPTLVFLFGAPIKAAGTLSLLIAVPTILVGLGRHRARGALRGRRELRDLIVPMGLGTIAGGIFGGAMVALVPSAALKPLLGGVLIGSALKVFAPRGEGR